MLLGWWARHVGLHTSISIATPLLVSVSCLASLSVVSALYSHTFQRIRHVGMHVVESHHERNRGHELIWSVAEEKRVTVTPVLPFFFMLHFCLACVWCVVQQQFVSELPYNCTLVGEEPPPDSGAADSIQKQDLRIAWQYHKYVEQKIEQDREKRATSVRSKPSSRGGQVGVVLFIWSRSPEIAVAPLILTKFGMGWMGVLILPLADGISTLPSLRPQSNIAGRHRLQEPSCIVGSGPASCVCGRTSRR